MCCDRSLRRPLSSLVLLLFVLLALPVALACGKRGDPLPPLRDVPLKTNDLTIRQQGRQILLELTYPAVTVNGLALGGIDAVELYEMIRPLDEEPDELLEGEESEAEDTALEEDAEAPEEVELEEFPEGSAEEIVEEDLGPEEESPAETVEEKAPEALEIPTVDPAEFENRSEELLTLRGAELGAALTGDRIQIRVPLAEELPEMPAAHYFAVRTVKEDESSDLSNLVGLVPMEPPPPPENLTVTAEANAVALAWESPPDGAVAFDVYRREARERGYGEPLQRVGGAERSFRDAGVTYGRRYIYTVRTVARLQPPLLSAEAGEREIDYEDRFPPDLPANFVALGERGRVRLRWNPSTATDVAGYVLYRREPGREFHRLDDALIGGVEYLDRGLTAGFSYDYRIQAVDGSGNESELSEIVSAEVR